MNTKLKLACWLLPCCLLAGLIVVSLAGCEGSSSDDVSGSGAYFDKNPYSSAPRTDPAAPTLELMPPSFVVSFINQEVAFTVSGGEGAYHWYISSQVNGAINSRGANQAVYIVKVVDQNSVTVQDDAGHYAVSYIQTSSSTGSVAMAVSPASVSLSGGELYASFTVVGGTAPFTWTSGNVQLGTVAYSAGTSYVAAYTAVSGAYGQNVITVVDAEGRVASATVTQAQ